MWTSPTQHPRSREERREVRERKREHRRGLMKTWRFMNLEELTENVMWWAGKQAVAHGNRCQCHYLKQNGKLKIQELRQLETEKEHKKEHKNETNEYADSF